MQALDCTLNTVMLTWYRSVCTTDTTLFTLHFTFGFQGLNLRARQKKLLKLNFFPIKHQVLSGGAEIWLFFLCYDSMGFPIFKLGLKSTGHHAHILTFRFGKATSYPLNFKVWTTSWKGSLPPPHLSTLQYNHPMVLACVGCFKQWSPFKKHGSWEIIKQHCKQRSNVFGKRSFLPTPR